MRALIISDVHANLEALEAVLAAAPAYDAVWNLGDSVGYGASPNEVVRQVRDLGAIFVRGNHDRACSGPVVPFDFSEIAAAAARWTQTALSGEHRDWLRLLPQGPIAALESQAICVHGTPYDEDDYLVSPADALISFQANPARLIFFGHTHRQEGFATNGEEHFHLLPGYFSTTEPEHYELPLRHNARYLLNPGSVGQPRDGDWRAAFALYDDVRELLTWHRIPYNVQKAQERIRLAGLPDRLADRLAIGR